MIHGYKKSFAYILAKDLPWDEETIASLIQMAPDGVEGDLAFPCFQLAKELQKSPVQIAQDLAASIQAPAGLTLIAV
jgi:arginyl-tRNA synthetase